MGTHVRIHVNVIEILIWTWVSRVKAPPVIVKFHTLLNITFSSSWLFIVLLRWLWIHETDADPCKDAFSTIMDCICILLLCIYYELCLAPSACTVKKSLLLQAYVDIFITESISFTKNNANLSFIFFSNSGDELGIVYQIIKDRLVEPSRFTDLTLFQRETAWHWMWLTAAFRHSADGVIRRR